MSAVKVLSTAAFIAFSAAPGVAQILDGSSLEQRQPLELVFADSIVPQDRHEMMLTTGAWYARRGGNDSGQLTQKMEWGISDKLQISAFVNPLHLLKSNGSIATGTGDFDLGGRYTWVNVGSPFTHVAVALEAGFPSGNPLKRMGEGAYGLSPSVLLSHEFSGGRYQAFSTAGFDFVLARRDLNPTSEIPRHESFVNSGFSARLGQGWSVAEFSISNNRWSGGEDTKIAITPSYSRRLARRTELLLGMPIGITSSADRLGGVVKFTFELGGE
jgi:hypothetical protein